jgi:hypothetical protein
MSFPVQNYLVYFKWQESVVPSRLPDLTCFLDPTKFEENPLFILAWDQHPDQDKNRN